MGIAPFFKRPRLGGQGFRFDILRRLPYIFLSRGGLPARYGKLFAESPGRRWNDMRAGHRPLFWGLLLGLALSLPPHAVSRPAQQTALPGDSSPLDEQVRKFLASQKDQWREENVTEADGRFLYDLILKHHYTRALEIGTSTGRSGIWQAWALSKTGGELITVEIDEFRHLRAIQNFKASGLAPLIDARLADAHELVHELPGPFDFVFIDADKNWTLNYFKALLPKLEVGGCFAVHNVVSLGFMRGIRDFLEYVRGLDYMETIIDSSSSGGISLSFKKKNPA
jgi:caffeoyl-CoA O-methyltransferase